MKFLYWLIFLVVCEVPQNLAQNSPQTKYGSNAKNGKYTTINGCKIYHEIYGEGVPLLLLHGGIGSIMNFEKCIPELADQFKVIALDTPGHGRSDHIDSLSYPLLTDYVSSFIYELKLDSLYVMGWSDGGVIGLRLAAEKPGMVKKLIAIGANTKVEALGEQMIDWVENQMIDWAKKEDGWWFKTYSPLMPKPDKLDDFLRNTQKMWLTDVYVPERKMEAIDIPVLFLQGDQDFINIEHALEMHRQVKNSQLCILPNTTHFVMGEKATLLNHIAIDFFKNR
jgi:pimeloyl-ACP methyl ester carboxylesterase